jgi:N-acetylmuramoyl-L-alanine amidase
VLPVRINTAHRKKGFLSYLSGMLRFFRLSFVLITLSVHAQTPSTNLILGRTNGVLPYLEYGLGSDRLGGAKMTYLDTGILVKVVDSTIINYKVQLSANHLAYLPKTSFIRHDSLTAAPYYLSNSWKIWGDDRYDYVVLPLEEKLPYRSIQQINPSRIVVEVFGVTNNTNWITQLSSAKEIKNVYHEQPEDDLFRIIIELKHPQHWGYHIYYENRKLVIRLKRQPPYLQLQHMRVAVDAGHGGDNNGASGNKTKILEKNYTLLIAKELHQALLEEKAAVLMTREKDTSYNMPDRILMLQREDPDFLISIHLNSSSKDSIRGTSTYYRYIGFRPLSQYIYKEMLKLGLPEFGNIGSFNFALSGPTQYPNCLVEVAFLSNKEDELLIKDPVFRKDVAKAIVAGIKEWLKSCEED